jgi:hypothetical protein
MSDNASPATGAANGERRTGTNGRAPDRPLAGFRRFWRFVLGGYPKLRAGGHALAGSPFSCPASDEMGKRTQCERCKLCSGSAGPNDPRKDIAILVHGAKAPKFRESDANARRAESLIRITRAA